MRWCGVLGAVLRQQGRSDEAVEFEENALAIARRALGEDDASFGTYMNNLAATNGALGRHEDALAMQESALEFGRRVLPPMHLGIAVSLLNICLGYEKGCYMRRAVRERA
jgi:hypothetical protein